MHALYTVIILIVGNPVCLSYFGKLYLTLNHQSRIIVTQHPKRMLCPPTGYRIQINAPVGGTKHHRNTGFLVIIFRYRVAKLPQSVNFSSLISNVHSSRFVILSIHLGRGCPFPSDINLFWLNNLNRPPNCVYIPLTYDHSYVPI